MPSARVRRKRRLSKRLAGVFVEARMVMIGSKMQVDEYIQLSRFRMVPNMVYYLVMLYSTTILAPQLLRIFANASSA